MEKAIISTALLIIYFHISGLATTNIIRLTAGNSLPVLSPICKCDACGKKISAFFQLPIISYIFCRGKCLNCKTKIPLYPLLLEITVLIGMSTITAFSKFSYSGVIFSFLFYELSRIVVIKRKGKRSSQFIKQYLIAVIIMIPFFLFSCFVAMLYQIV